MAPRAANPRQVEHDSPNTPAPALLALFDGVWERARPLRVLDSGLAEVDAEAGLDAEDRQILTLLLAGLTNASIASWACPCALSKDECAT